ncbi:hypothetical protein GMDG_06874 [Pseudogymnoascus destructans 20631-21]|uniref:Uncharacterized protein n=1 Tax=Pseudogymnoascus destructans (strain ATCC MYA-4855 / 20631-21) TaxID=658429 RepID=L8FUR4_PSED2|nr:hypothetical protein GMDG_06874 [Pseudogymnoascus destructans 20631-21]
MGHFFLLRQSPPPLFAARAAWRSAPPTGYDRRVVIQRLYNDRAQARRARIAIAARNHPSRSIRLSVAEQNAFLEAQNELLNSLTEEQLMASDADPLGTPPPWMNSSILSQLRDEQSASVLPSASALPPSENNSAERRRFRLPRVDGLGDRERSLSPGGDGEWDTLLTTISPDPQPPSAGSSFASTSASDAASSVPTSTSSATSIGPPIEVDYGTSFENICEYVEANSPSSDPDEEEQEMLDFLMPVKLERGSGADTQILWQRELTESLDTRVKLMGRVWEACNALSGDWLADRTFQMSGGQKLDSAGLYLASWSSHDKSRKSFSFLWESAHH